MQHAIEAIPRERRYPEHILFSKIDSQHIFYFRHEAEIPCKNPLAE